MPHTVPLTGASKGARPRWWTELPLIALVYGAYSAGRLLARGDVSTAVDHGLGILHLEQSLNVDFETPLNRVFTEHASIGIPADFAYASLHYLLTPLILVWLWRRRPANYRVMRTWLLLSTLMGLIGFTLMPTCPPRLLDASHGFVDTMAQYGSYGWWGGEASAPRGMGGFTNQYAAMPSLHVGWALWCGVALWRYGRSKWTKVLAVAYPLSIALVVMGTANHYFLDAVAGAAVMGIGYLLARPALRTLDRAVARFRGGAQPQPANAAAGTAAGATGAVPTGDGSAPESGESAPAVGAGCETAARERTPIPRQHGAGRGTDGERGDAGTERVGSADLADDTAASRDFSRSS